MLLKNLFIISIIITITGYGCVKKDNSTGPKSIEYTYLNADLSVDYFDIVLRDDTLDVDINYEVQDSLYFAEEAEYFFNVIYPKKKVDSDTIDYDTTNFLNGNHITTDQCGSFSDKLPASYFYNTEYEGMTLLICIHRKTVDTSYMICSMLYFLVLDLNS